MASAMGGVQRMPERSKRSRMRFLQAPSMTSSNCTSISGWLSSGDEAGHCWPSAERGFGVGGEGDADCTGGRLAMGDLAGAEPVVAGAGLDTEAGGDFAHGELAGFQGRRPCETDRVSDGPYVV